MGYTGYSFDPGHLPPGGGPHLRTDPANIASQVVVGMPINPIHPRVMDTDNIRGGHTGGPSQYNAYLGNIQLPRNVNQNAQPRVLTGAPVRARDT